MKRSLPVLPNMQCDDGCGDCCGLVPVTAKEYSTISAFIKDKNIRPRAQGITCPLYHDGRCSVYSVRPSVCQLYGHIERLPCSRGYNTNISAKEEKKFLKVHEGTIVTTLHHLLGDYDALLDVESYIRRAIDKELRK